jgi:legumain
MQFPGLECLQYHSAAEGSTRKLKAGEELVNTMAYRMHLDNSVELIGNLLFGSEAGPSKLNAIRPAGQVLVDDWDCLKSMVRLRNAEFVQVFYSHTLVQSLEAA